MIHPIIENRRSIYPKTYNDTPLHRSDIETLLRAANCAPNHKRTEPWRFCVFLGNEAMQDLANFWGKYYLENTENATENDVKYLKGQQNCLRSAAAIALVVHYTEKVPRIEETCAVACAAQNLLLQASADGLGAFWSTGGPVKSAAHTRDFLQLLPNETCLGFIFLGNHDLPRLPSAVGDYAEKVQWYTPT